MTTGSIVAGFRSRLPAPVRTLLRSARRPIAVVQAHFRRIRFGSLRRLTPIDRDFGFGRGKPIDRHYIEEFLARHSPDIRGSVLEIGDDGYTRRFGGDAVADSNILHVDETNPRATIVADLAVGDGIPSEAFDCVILTQTLHLVYDVRAAVVTLHRILRPGGVVLITVPGISQVAAGTKWGATWYWAFTVLSLRRVLEEVFDGADVRVEARGNVLSAIAFLHGLATEELKPEELDHVDPDYPVVVSARAVKRVRPG